MSALTAPRPISRAVPTSGCARPTAAGRGGRRAGECAAHWRCSCRPARSACVRARRDGEVARGFGDAQVDRGDGQRPGALMGQRVAGAAASARGNSASAAPRRRRTRRCDCRWRACPWCPRSARCGRRAPPAASGSWRRRSPSAAETTPQRRTGEPVENVLRPLMRQPPSVRVAVVAGRPPRLGLPSSGSLARLLISAPAPSAPRRSRGRRDRSTSSGHRCASRTRPSNAPCIATTSAERTVALGQLEVAQHQLGDVAAEAAQVGRDGQRQVAGRGQLGQTFGRETSPSRSCRDACWAATCAAARAR